MTLADGLPAWSCTTACPHLIRTVPKVRWDENDPEVEDESCESHSFESCGRLFQARPVHPKIAKPDPYAHLDDISASHHRALDQKLDPTTGTSRGCGCRSESGLKLIGNDPVNGRAYTQRRCAADFAH